MLPTATRLRKNWAIWLLLILRRNTPLLLPSATTAPTTPEYYEKLKELDVYVGQIVQAVKDAGMLDDTIFILTSDHGGIDKGHGGKTMQEMETAFIISGKNIKKGLRFDDVSMMQYDVASTIARIFHLEQPQVWIGRPMEIVFK